MSKKRRSLHVAQEMDRAVQEMRDRADDAERFPAFDSLADVYRHLLDFALENADLADLASEQARVLAERQRFVDHEARVRNLRTGFETRVKQEFKKRYENGYGPEKLQEYAENMAREAHILWPEWSGQDHSERRQEALSYVKAVAEHAAENADKSAWDPLDPEDMFGQYSGVEQAEQEDEQEQHEAEVQEFVPTACSMLNDGARPSRIERRLVSVHGAPAEVASEALERAIERDGVVPKTRETPDMVMTENGPQKAGDSEIDGAEALENDGVQVDNLAAADGGEADD